MSLNFDGFKIDIKSNGKHFITLNTELRRPKRLGELSKKKLEASDITVTASCSSLSLMLSITARERLCALQQKIDLKQDLKIT